MKFSNLLAVILLSTTTLSAFQDKDLDGIDDTLDLCLNTPFDAKVDKYGCAVTTTAPKNDFSQITLSVGSIIRTDEIYEDDSSMSFYANYRYNNWDFSLSNIRSLSQNDYTQDYTNNDDIYLSLGYTFYILRSALKLTAGSNIRTDEAQNRDNDYFASLSLVSYINLKQDIFLYYGYTLSGESDEYDYEDYSSFSLGSGYQFTRNYYSALSYNYTGSSYTGGEDEESISWYNSYNISKNLFVTGTYSYALNDLSYDNTFAFNIGLRF